MRYFWLLKLPHASMLHCAALTLFWHTLILNIVKHSSLGHIWTILFSSKLKFWGLINLFLSSLPDSGLRCWIKIGQWMKSLSKLLDSWVHLPCSLFGLSQTRHLTQHSLWNFWQWHHPTFPGDATPSAVSIGDLSPDNNQTTVSCCPLSLIPKLLAGDAALRAVFGSLGSLPLWAAPQEPPS